ncbi:glycosyltransferase [Prochlorococcus marinus]|uniref:glycosyltransferase n=1 Tax=Prochlorococcus TaxID=1218 RepID=UPI0007BBE334|nr:glycosyltransferase [Prochlorococcus marinus]KZR77691.1 Chondroitin synthase [Prochlorococcus marinus str. MIT 1323]
MSTKSDKSSQTDQANVCVGISTYRQPLAWIKNAVESVLAQKYRNWQILIRPDGPNAISNENLTWLTELESNEPRLHVMPEGKQLGTFGSYRHIFSQTKATYLVQLDADDMLHNQALEKAVQYLDENLNCPFLYSQCNLIDKTGKTIGVDQRALRPWKKNLDLVQFMTFHMRLVRRSAYLKVGGYDSNFRFAGDYDLSLKLSELAEPQHIAEPLYSYRLHSESESQLKRKATHQEAIKAARSALKRRGLQDEYTLIHSLKTESISITKKTNHPIVIAGMHRSGTSLLARMLNKLGVAYGLDHDVADADNPDGYYEDREFLELQRKWFISSLNENANGWNDWGWNPIQSISSLGQANWKIQAENLLNQRQISLGDLRWGWKDPRTTLILPFWRQLRPGLKLIAIYRAPWDISDALQRLNYHQFRTNPEMILPIWKLYNKRLVEYVEAEPERSVLLHAETLAAKSDNLASIIQDRWDWPLDTEKSSNELGSLIRPNRLQSIKLPDPIETLYKLVFPDLVEIWERLQDKADLSDLEASDNNNYMKLINIMKPEKPELCIIIPTYNPCHYLLEALASIERYRPKNIQIEIIIVDDGSTFAGSIELLDKLKLVGYQIISLNKSGLAAARNAGIKASTAELILPLDDDNRLLGIYLNDGLEYMSKNLEVDFFYGDRIDFGAVRARFRPGALTADELIKANRIDACAIIRRNLWEKCGGYDETLTALEDWDLLLSGLKIGMKSCYAPEPAFEYRVRESSMLRRHLANKKVHFATIDYLRNKHQLPIAPLVDKEAISSINL